MLRDMRLITFLSNVISRIMRKPIRRQSLADMAIRLVPKVGAIAAREGIDLSDPTQIELLKTRVLCSDPEEISCKLAVPQTLFARKEFPRNSAVFVDRDGLL
ncbi:hypothetical protein [Xylella fastidiosa]|uniref:hypothetical protein n=1 Tax=Xylella fastidiosa TaxID=2371 RepID=UPI0007659126|nr:hypothetical protein [Xylella fastidiosa]KXB20319.1 hypothetical protein ADT30_07780 [Xylella fastidiosa]